MNDCTTTLTCDQHLDAIGDICTMVRALFEALKIAMVGGLDMDSVASCFAVIARLLDEIFEHI